MTVKDSSSPAADKQSNDAWVKWAVLVVLTIQNSSVPLLMRSAQTGTTYCVPLVVLMTESMKFVASFFLLAWEKGSFGAMADAVRKDILCNPEMTLKLAVPAILYFMLNNFIQYANYYLPAALYTVSYQAKTFVVAILSVFMLQKRLQRYKWLGIAGLATGVAMVQLSKASDDESKKDPSGMAKGLGFVFCAILCSAFAGVFFEKMLKFTGNGEKPSVWVRNIQLAGWNIVVSLPAVYSNEVFDISDPFKGFNTVVYALVVDNACGGLIVALILKYADNILKGFSNALSTIIATLISVPLFGFEINWTFSLGAGTVLLSTFVYGNLIKFSDDWWDEVILSYDGKRIAMDKPSSPAPQKLNVFIDNMKKNST
eukprot:CAMPEP_0197527170 /NCGR_PEP_ID=MMETSP1318-20131121/20574_1 /TAXON_ID=552666 /ORGANISM="Partenskyella glossopodia, Strain RCC365" /LENGTH=370 /DNA_ID=CAMNT_0043081671 /DNA_START=48 /DNA_END=1160 /DNA_ORIENTATION=+